MQPGDGAVSCPVAVTPEAIRRAFNTAVEIFQSRHDVGERPAILEDGRVGHDGFTIQFTAGPTFSICLIATAADDVKDVLPTSLKASIPGTQALIFYLAVLGTADKEQTLGIIRRLAEGAHRLLTDDELDAQIVKPLVFHLNFTDRKCSFHRRFLVEGGGVTPVESSSFAAQEAKGPPPK